MNNFYTIYGLDKERNYNESKKIITKLKIDDQIKYDMDISELPDIIEDARTISMFSSKKIIILDNCNFLNANKTIPDLEIFENYIETPNKDTYLILINHTDKIDTRKKINKLLKEHGKVIELKRIDVNDLTKYVEEYLTKENFQMENINYFIDKTGTILSNVNNELDKLMMYKLESKVITNEDIDKITIKSVEEEIFTLSDAIITGNTQKSLALLEEFLNKSYDEMQIIMLLASQFRHLLQVKRLLNKSKTEQEIAKILEINPYRVKFSVKKLYYYTEDTLCTYIKRLAKIDHDIKLGLMDKRLALELFIINSSKERFN